MAIGSKYSRERRRRRGQFMLRAAKWLLIVGIFVGLGVWSYQSGLELARAEVTALERRIANLSADARDVYARNAALEGELRQARADMVALQRRYEQDVPRGDAAALFSLVQGRIAAGVPRARMEQVVRDAGPIRRCEGRGTVRRFAIAYGRVPEGAGIELQDGVVRVVVSAPAPTDDLARAASVAVTVAGGETLTLTGLPQRHPVVLGNVEFTLNVAASDVRGFAQASLSGC